MGASIFFTAAMIRACEVTWQRWDLQSTSHHCHVNSLTSQAQIIAAVKNFDAPMLTRVWQELEYRIDVCRVTRGAHIEHL
jgi:hypothetical protein